MLEKFLNFIFYLFVFIAITLLIVGFLGCFAFTGKIIAEVIVYIWY